VNGAIRSGMLLRSQCGHSLTNIQSKRVIEKCGFKYVKTREHYSESMGVVYRGMKYILFKPQE